jgi:hypothetical protein
MDFSNSGATASWLVFLGIMVAACLIITIGVVWFTVLRKSSGKKKRKNRSRRRQKNPTLAETGGLPPVRAARKSDGPEASA